jgi:hypothetical protein
MVRSMVQRWRPSRWEVSMPLRRCGAGFLGRLTIAAGGCSRNPCRHGACGACAAGAPAGSDRRYAPHERDQYLTVVRVGARDADVHRVDRAPRPVQLTTGSEFVEDQAVELGPHPGFRPLGETPVSRRSGRPELRGRHLLPRAARGRHEDQAGTPEPRLTRASKARAGRSRLRRMRGRAPKPTR